MNRKPIVAIILNKMPFDRYTDEDGFIHATGREIVFDDGTSRYEYEDDGDTFCDLPVEYEEEEEEYV